MGGEADMSDDLDKKQEELKKIQEDLKETGLSRRNFLDRLKGVGVGFGAAFVLGSNKADARDATDAGLSVKSTNPALDGILEEAKQAQLDEGSENQKVQAREGKVDPDDPLSHMAYRRFYRRGYRRFYRRGYRRFWYRRFYRRGYRRFYRRFYRRW
jgi:hypothetical protein